MLLFGVILVLSGCSGASDDPDSVAKYEMEAAQVQSKVGVASTALTSALRGKPGGDTWKSGLVSAGQRFKLIGDEISHISPIPPSCQPAYDALKKVGEETDQISTLLTQASGESDSKSVDEAKQHLAKATALIQSMPVPVAKP